MEAKLIRRNVPLPDSERAIKAELIQFESPGHNETIYTFKLPSGDFIEISVKNTASYLDRNCDLSDTQANLAMYLRVLEHIGQMAHRFIVVHNP